jgi:enoyl-CoA hydratase/carnithine racemase
VLLSANFRLNEGGLRSLLRSIAASVLTERHRQRVSLTVLFKGRKIDIAQYAERVTRVFEHGHFGLGYVEEMLWTAEALSAEDAYRLGLVNRVVPIGQLEAATTELAQRIATMPPFAVRSTKKSINDALDFMGQGRSWEHHFLIHVAGKRSEEYDRFWTSMEAEGGGFKAGGLKVTLDKLGRRKPS